MTRNLFQYLVGLIILTSSCSPKLLQHQFAESTYPISTNNLKGFRTIIQGDTTDLKDISKLPTIVQDLNEASYNGIWKNIFWDQFQLIYEDSVVTYRTNGFVFSHEKSLHYFDVPSSVQDVFFVTYE